MIMMKNSDNTRRTKTHPDQASMFSNSSNKSMFSTDRKSSVRIACKVMSEMRQDNNDKLQMKFTQLRIVLASQSIIHLLKKCRTTKLQAYFLTLKTIQNKTDLPQIKSKQPKSVQFKDQSHFHVGVKILRSILTIKLLKAFQLIQANKQSLKTSVIEKEQKTFNLLEKLFNRRINVFFIKMKQLNQIKKGLNTINIIFQGYQRKIFYSTFLNIAQSIHSKRKSIGYQNQQFSEREIQGNPLTQYKVSLLTQSFEYIDLQDRVSVCSGSQTIEDDEINSENEFMTMNLAIKFASTTTLNTTMNKIILKNYFHVYIKLQNLKKNILPKINTVQNTPKAQKLQEVQSPKKLSQDIQSLKYIESQQVSLNILPETTQNIYIQPIQTINSEQDEERERQKMIATNKLKNLFLFQIKVNFIHFRINLLEGNSEILQTVQSNKSDSSMKYYKPKSSKQKQTTSQKKLQAFVKKIYKEDNILTNFSSSQQKSTDITNNLESGTKLSQKQKQQQIKVEQYQDDFKPEGLNKDTKIPTQKSLIFNSEKFKQNQQTNKVSEAVKQYLVLKTDNPLLKSVYLEQNQQSKQKQKQKQSYFKMNRLFWILMCIVIPLIIGSVLII